MTEMMGISYAITVCTEAQELKRLLDFLVPYIRRGVDEIVVLQDVSKKSEDVDRILIDRSDDIECRVTMEFGGHFADWKNEFHRICKKDYIFQIDADECPSQNLVEFLPKVLEMNPEVEMFRVPRANQVKGITAEDIERWGWRVVKVSGHEYINWPDYQSRIYRNIPQVRWDGKVHETIIGYKRWANLPDSMFLYHDKEIQKQRAQNAFYNQLIHESN